MKKLSDYPLTPKQQLFCNEYLTDLNATRAALRAGYSAATALSGKLMTLPKIKAHLKLRTKKAAKKLTITRQEMLTELKRVAFASMGDYFDDDGKLKPLNLLTADQKAAIWSLKIGADGSVNLRLNNKLTALEKIAHHIGFYNAVEEDEEDVNPIYLDQQQMDENDRYEDDSLTLKTDDGGQQWDDEDNEDDEDDEDDEVPEDERDERWERDQVLILENEILACKEKLIWQRQRARAEAVANNDEDWFKRFDKADESQPEMVEEATKAAVELKVEPAAAESVQTTATTRTYGNYGLFGKATTKEERLERKSEYHWATGNR